MRKLEQPTTASYQSWTSEPLFTRKQVEAITERASLISKMRLIFRRSRYVFDDGAMFRYKEMDGKIYVMKRDTRL